MKLYIFLIAFCSVFLTSIAQIFLKKTMCSVDKLPNTFSDMTSFIISIIFNYWFVLGISFYIISLGLWLIVLKKIDITIAYPLSAIGFVITAFIAYIFLNENMSIIRITGLSLIILGIIVISKS